MDLAPCNVLSLATGAGGLDLGIRLAVPSARLVCAVEIEAYACEVLASRMEEGRLDPAPIWTDLRTFDGRPWRGVVDLLSAGYPCQPFSVAGKMRGTDDPRHLWPHVARVIRECEPSFVFLENVANHLNIGFREVRDELRGMGYRVEAGLFEACEAGAPHHRRRLYVLAYSDSYGCQGERGRRVFDGVRSALGHDAHGRGGAPTDVGNTDSSGLEGRWLRVGGGPHELPAWPPGPEDAVGWRRYLARWPGLEPAVHGRSHGLASRVDRLRLTGNGVVPQQAAHAFLYLLCQHMRSRA